MHALKVSIPPFAAKVSPITAALNAPQVPASHVEYAVDTIRKQWLDAMLNDALLVLLQVGSANEKHVKAAHASLQFGLVCAIYSGQREGMPDFDRIKVPLAACVSCVKEGNAQISAPLAVSVASAIELCRRYVRNATPKAIYQTCVAVQTAQATKAQ